MRRVMAMSLALMLAMPAVAQDQIGGGETEIGNGTASYYGRELAGNRTASGERFDPDQMTAAHPTLAFGSKVRGTNLSNGQSVIVRVNDRPIGSGKPGAVTMRLYEALRAHMEESVAAPERGVGVARG